MDSSRVLKKPQRLKTTLFQIHGETCGAVEGLTVHRSLQREGIEQPLCQYKEVQ